jgi:hypothetical protein
MSINFISLTTSSGVSPKDDQFQQLDHYLTSHHFWIPVVSSNLVVGSSTCLFQKTLKIEFCCLLTANGQQWSPPTHTNSFFMQQKLRFTHFGLHTTSSVLNHQSIEYFANASPASSATGDQRYQLLAHFWLVASKLIFLLLLMLGSTFSAHCPWSS